MLVIVDCGMGNLQSIVRAFALAPPQITCRPQLPDERWLAGDCSSVLQTEDTWAAETIDAAAALTAAGHRQQAAELLRQAARSTFASVALFDATAKALLAIPDDPAAAEAVYWAQRADLASESRNPSVQITLAAAYASHRQLDEAIATIEKARRLALKQADSALVGELDARLQEYRGGLRSE